jgi:alkylhydroperoxidase family enzyme
LTDDQIVALKEPGGKHRQDIFSAGEQAILRFADLLTSYPGNVDQSDLDALGALFTEAQIIELTMTIATANWLNRINDGPQTPVPSTRR